MSARRPPFSPKPSGNPPTINFSLFEKNEHSPQRLRHADSFGSYGSQRLSNGSQQSSSLIHANPFSDPAYSNSNSLSSSRGISSKFSLHPDPNLWGYDVSPSSVEEDDWLHKPDKRLDETGTVFTGRGFTGVGCLLLLLAALVGLFLGYPLTTAILHRTMSTNGGYNLGGINSTGQIMEGKFSLIDKDTPQELHTKVSPVDGRTMQLVFSDEFEVEGRTFYPGDDPYWEAVDLYYWGTKDLEWYDPGQITTKDGKLVIEFKQQLNHDLQYMGV
jgi:hypothetical protein